MPAYDAKQFDPPAPVAYVTLRHHATGVSISDVPMLLDTGADVTLLPREIIEQLGVELVENKVYEVEGFDGGTKLAEAVQLEMVFLGRKFKGQFLLIDQPVGILGRNTLNAVVLLLNGPRGTWDEQKR
jgi:predicted aspartyl protease